MKEQVTVTVCDKCLMASCWQGVFYCEEYKNAGITEKSVGELRKLGLESSTYWQNNKSTK